MAPKRIKIVTVGDYSCGKTSLIMTYIRDGFPDPIPTVYETPLIDRMVDGKEVELAIWDTVSHGDYARLRPLSYPDTHAVIMCFSVASLESFHNISNVYIPEIRSHLPKDVPILLVGNKKDLRDNENTSDELLKTNQELVKMEDAKALAEEIGVTGYLECSAKDNDGVTFVFETAIRAGLKRLAQTKKPKCTLL